MGMLLPPYMNKHLDRLKNELEIAEKKEQIAKSNYETAQEYTKLCREVLENVEA